MLVDGLNSDLQFGRIMGKFAVGLVMALLFLIHGVMLQLHSAMAARELPSSVMAAAAAADAADDRRGVVTIIQTDRTMPGKLHAPPAPKPNSPQHFKPPIPKRTPPPPAPLQTPPPPPPLCPPLSS